MSAAQMNTGLSAATYQRTEATAFTVATGVNGLPALEWPAAANARFLATSANVTAQDTFFVLRYGDGKQTQWIASNQGVFGGAAGNYIGLIGDLTTNALWYSFCDFQGMRRNGAAQPNLGASVQALPLPPSIIGSSRPTGSLTAPISIGMDRNISNLNRGWSGAIGEVIVLPSIASEADRQRIEGYLAWKWSGLL